MAGPGRPKGSSAIPVSLPCGCPATAGAKTYWKVRRLPGGIRICSPHNMAFRLEWARLSFEDVGKFLNGNGKKRVVVRRTIPVGVRR